MYILYVLIYRSVVSVEVILWEFSLCIWSIRGWALKHGMRRNYAQVRVLRNLGEEPAIDASMLQPKS